MEVQTRDDEGGLNFFGSVEEAFEYAKTRPSVWKISFNAEDGSRVRLVRSEGVTIENVAWRFEPISLETREE